MNSMNEDRETKFIYMGDPQPNRLNGYGPDYSRWGKLLQLAAEKAYGKETAERWSLPEAAAKREEVFSESDPVATVFRVTDSAVKLETINDSGDIVDAYTKAVNAKPKKDCSRCPKFEECRGTGNAGGAGADNRRTAAGVRTDRCRAVQWKPLDERNCRDRNIELKQRMTRETQQ